MTAAERTEPMVNGALIALGVLAILDNTIAHWILGLHRAIPGPYALYVELGLIVLGSVVLLLGLMREVRARKRGERGPK